MSVAIDKKRRRKPLTYGRIKLLLSAGRSISEIEKLSGLDLSFLNENYVNKMSDDLPAKKFNERLNLSANDLLIKEVRKRLIDKGQNISELVDSLLRDWLHSEQLNGAGEV